MAVKTAQKLNLLLFVVEQVAAGVTYRSPQERNCPGLNRIIPHAQTMSGWEKVTGSVSLSGHPKQIGSCPFPDVCIAAAGKQTGLWGKFHMQTKAEAWSIKLQLSFISDVSALMRTRTHFSTRPCEVTVDGSLLYKPFFPFSVLLLFLSVSFTSEFSVLAPFLIIWMRRLPSVCVYFCTSSTLSSSKHPHWFFVSLSQLLPFHSV